MQVCMYVRKYVGMYECRQVSIYICTYVGIYVLLIHIIKHAPSPRINTALGVRH